MVSIPLLNLLAKLNIWLIRVGFVFALVFLARLFYKLKNKKKLAFLVVIAVAFFSLFAIPKFNILYNDEFYYNSMAFSIKDYGINYLYHESAEVFGPYPKCAVFPYLINISYYFTKGNPYSSIYVNMILYSLSAGVLLLIFFEVAKGKIKRKHELFYGALFVLIFLTVYYLKNLSRNGETHPTSIFFVLLFILVVINFLNKGAFKEFIFLVPIGFIAGVSRPENLFIPISLLLFGIIFPKNKSSNGVDEVDITKKRGILGNIIENKKLILIISAILIGILCIPNFLVIYGEYFNKSWQDSNSNFSILYFYDNVVHLLKYFFITLDFWFLGLIALGIIASLSLVLIEILATFFNRGRIVKERKWLKCFDEDKHMLYISCLFLCSLCIIFISAVNQNRAPRVYSIIITLAVVWLIMLFVNAFKIKEYRKVFTLLLVLFVGLNFANDIRLSYGPIRHYFDYSRSKQLEFIEDIFQYTKNIDGEFYVMTQYPEALAFLKDNVIDTADFMLHKEFYKDKRIFLFFKNLYFAEQKKTRSTIDIEVKRIYKILTETEKYEIEAVFDKDVYVPAVGYFNLSFEQVLKE